MTYLLVKLGRVWFGLKKLFFKLWFYLVQLFYQDKLKMDLDKIFSEFNKGVEQEEKRINLELLTDNPTIMLGMFRKIILNSIYFNKKVEKLFDKGGLQFPRKDLIRASEFIVYHRAWYYISNIDVSIEINKNAIKLSADEDLLKATNLAMKFFEDIEEYEKCALIKKIHDEIELSLAKNLAS